MDLTYLVEYFLFTFFASFGVVQISLARKNSLRLTLGFVILVASYVWFFSSRNRNVPSIVEGVQLFLVFAVSVIASLLLTKLFSLVFTKKR